MFSLWSISLFAIGIVLVLMVLFPKQRIINQVAQASHASSVSTFFLENLLKSKPEDTDLRLLLTQHQLAIGHMEHAQKTIAPLLMSENVHVRLNAHEIDLHMLKTRTFAFPADSSARRDGVQQIEQRIQLLVPMAQDFDAERLDQFAQLALMIGEQDLAQSIYEQLAKRPEPQTVQWYAKAAELALGQGAYQKAATLYFSAQHGVNNQQEKRGYYVAALKALQSGNLLKQAIEQAKRHVSDIQHDEATLIFLVSLGRAAGDGSFAQKYVKDLLQVTWTKNTFRYLPVNAVREAPTHTRTFFLAPTLTEIVNDEYFRTLSSRHETFHSLTVAARRRATPNAQSKQQSKFRTFHDQMYQLGYAVFLENQNLEDAFQLAQAAVQQAPHLVTWRKKYAQVAEWTGRQQIALAQWRKIAEMKPNQEPFGQILRLAPGAYDDENLVFALLGLGKIRTLSESEWRTLADAYERLGKPDEAVAYLTHLHQQNPNPAFLEHMAHLYQRMGQDTKAYRYYRELETQYGSRVTWATQQAGLLSSRGHVREAYDMLRHVKQQAKDDDDEYWKFIGHLAWMLEDDPQAEEAYQRLRARQQLSIEAQERLILLLRNTNPLEAIDVSLAGWKTFHSPKFLLQALDLQLHERQIDQVQSTLEGLVPWEEALIVHLERYWIIRAEVMWKIGKHAEALQAYERALNINPESNETKEAMLWFLVDQQHRTALAFYLDTWQDSIEADARLWGPVAAAYVVLDRHAQALPYFVRQLQTRRHDYLWLLNYAAALEASSQIRQAWHVRQHAWLKIRQSLLTHPTQIRSTETIEALATLTQLNDPGDPLLTLLRNTRTHMTSPVMKELILAWFLSQEAFDAAKQWLWNAYAQQLREPGWAKLAIALADNDWVEIEAITYNYTDNLSISDHIEAANRLDRKTIAQELAFNSLTRHPDRDATHIQFQEAIMTAADRITSHIMFEERRPLSSYVSKTAMAIQLGRIEVRPEASVAWQESVDSKALTGVPRIDRQFGVSLAYQWPAGTIRLTGFHRNALAHVFGLQMDYEQVWNEHLSSTLTIGRNQKANDSVVLQIGGMKDFMRGQGLYYVSKRQFVSLQMDAQRFYSQSRDTLGRGLGVEGAIGHHLRRDYPDVTVRVVGTVQRYWRVPALPGSITRLIPHTDEEPTPLQVVPQNFSQGGIQISLGDSIRDLYTKGIRPFGLLGVNYNSATGLGQSIEAGLISRLIGQDHIQLSGSYIQGGFGQNATTTQVNLHYQRWF
ncbi:tetratricopeptide repeat protein [Nitrospira sp. M1]